MTDTDMETIRTYQSDVAGRYPIRWVEVEQVDGLTFADGVGWPEGVESAYVVQRSRKVDGRMRDVVVHVAPRQMDAVRWALADASGEGQ